MASRKARQHSDAPLAALLLGRDSMGAAMLLLMAVAAPLVLSGYGGYVDWMDMEDTMEERHEFFANSAMDLVVALLTLITRLSVLRRRNLATPMLTGRTPGLVLTSSRPIAAGWAFCYWWPTWGSSAGRRLRATRAPRQRRKASGAAATTMTMIEFKSVGAEGPPPPRTIPKSSMPARRTAPAELPTVP